MPSPKACNGMGFFFKNINKIFTKIFIHARVKKRVQLVEKPAGKIKSRNILRFCRCSRYTHKEKIMSRIGKKPIEIPSGVEISIDGHTVTAKGPLGTESVTVRPEIEVKVEDNHIILTKVGTTRETDALYGLSRTLVANAVHGVKEGFEKKLEIQGVGYRANMEGKNLNLALGYSHPVIVEPPAGITITVEANTKISVKGSNKQTVGDIAAFIRSKRPPEVYKGKGIRYEGEHIRRKAGKAGKK